MAADEAEDLRRQQENLARRAEDRKLVEELARENFTGPRYSQYEDELARYGLSVLHGWMYTGRVFPLVARRGYPLNPTDDELEALHCDPDARGEIATATIGRSLPQFRAQALVKGGWHYDAGASIPTYFMGATLSVFPNEFRRWRTQRTRWKLQDHGDYTANGLHRNAASDDPADLVLGKMRVADDLNRISPRARDIVALTMAGYQQEEIVEILGEPSVRAVQGVLHRWRTAEKKSLREGGDRGGTA